MISSNFPEVTGRIDSILLKIKAKIKSELFDNSTQLFLDDTVKNSKESKTELEFVDFQQDTEFEEQGLKDDTSYYKKILEKNYLTDLFKKKLKADIQTAIETINLKDYPIEVIQTDSEHLKELLQLEKSILQEGQANSRRKSKNIRKDQVSEKVTNKKAKILDSSKTNSNLISVKMKRKYTKRSIKFNNEQIRIHTFTNHKLPFNPEKTRQSNRIARSLKR